MSHPIADIAVIGAGIIGTSIAERLQYEGQKVWLIDRNQPGEGCSKGNAGHFATDIILPLANFSTLLKVPALLSDPLGPLSIQWHYFPKLLPWLIRFSWAAMPHKSRTTIEALKQLNRPSIERFQALLNRTKLQDLMTNRGALTVFSTAKSQKKCLQHMRLVEPHGVNVSLLNAQALNQLEPSLSENVLGALYYPDTAHSINPHRLVTGLADVFINNGGKFIQQQIERIENKSDHLILHSNGQTIAAKQIVIACGAWSKKLAQDIGHTVPLETERGYHLTIESPNVEITRPVTSFEDSFVMTPMEQGLRLAGTVELAGLDAPPNYQRADILFQHAKKLLPQLINQKSSNWMGMRPSLPDSLPIIGRSSRSDNVLMAFGHQHLGLTQAAVTADIISDLIIKNKSPIDITPYKIERF